MALSGLLKKRKISATDSSMARERKELVIAIDGPAGSGKSTVSKLVAKALGVLYIDTGAMYRALTLKAMRARNNLEDEKALTDLARTTRIELKDKGALHVFLDGEDVTNSIRTPEVTANVRYIARTLGVRQEMVKLQRALGEESDAMQNRSEVKSVDVRTCHLANLSVASLQIALA